MLWLGSSICGFEGMCEIDSGCGSAWLERLVWDQEVAGSNPVTPIVCGCSSMVEHQPSKLDTWVRFPSPAFHLQIIMESIIHNRFLMKICNLL